MRTWQGCLLGVAVLATAGCRTNPHVTALERELRLQEDRIYQLEDSLEDAQCSLASCQKENESLRNRLKEKADAAVRGALAAPPGVPEEPKVELPDTGQFKSDLPPSLRGWSPRETPTQSPGPAEPPAPEEPPAARPGPRLPAQPMPAPESEAPPWRPKDPDAASSGSDAGESPIEEISLGDVAANVGGAADELAVVLHPRDALGQPVIVPGPVSVVLVDPALTGDAARLARWDFSAAQVAGFLRDSGAADGIRLALAWPNLEPAHDRLHLFVRYTTPDGRKLQADRPIRVSQLAQVIPPQLLQVPRETPPPRSIPSSAATNPPPQRVSQRPRRPTWSPER